MNNHRLLAAFWVVLALTIARGVEARAEGPAPSAVLYLKNGGFVAGSLVDSDLPGVLGWQGDAFTIPFDFDLNWVESVRRPGSPTQARPRGEYRFELTGGDVLYGSLVALTDASATLDVPRLGRLRLDRGSLERIDAWRDGADLVYLGPTGLTGWREFAPEAEKGWRDDSGELVSDRDATAILGEVGLPARAVIAFEIAWTKAQPDFVLALGVIDDEAITRRAFRFEVWANEIVALRETDDATDLASVATLSPGPGRIQLVAYLDQERGRLLVASPDGRTLADLSLLDGPPRVRTAIRLENKSGTTRLERLRISRWDGTPPREQAADRPHVARSDGSIVLGQVARFDDETREFVVRARTIETRVAEGQFASALLAIPGVVRPRAIRVGLDDGIRLSGELKSIEDGVLRLAVPGIEEAARLPVASIRSLVVLQRGDTSPPNLPGPTGRLELEGVRLHGALAPGEGLAWHPFGSGIGSPLAPGTSGRIVYRQAPGPGLASVALGAPPVAAQPARPAAPPQRVGLAVAVIQGLTGSRPTPPQGPARAPGTPTSIYLRDGDVIPAEVTKIDDAGVTFTSPVAGTTVVSHDKVKAVELAVATPATVRITRSKRDRLLTVPRMQKDSPPTHLVRSKDGDYLRGRVVGLDAKTLRVEVRLDTKDVPRDRVSRIIWLHADETGPPRSAARPPDPSRDGPTRVQAVRNDGTRMTFVADRLEASTLQGRSDVLRACHVDLATVDRLLIGSAIEQEASRLAYMQWTLRDAPEPKAAQALGASAGTESPLVGKPAPDFALDLLDGKKFRLSESKGTVVVLDFWATWCGPCLQAMPQVDKVTREFHDQGVRLVAVNLQEAPKEITAMLQRHKLDLTVALDRDGVAAEKFNATAIPQTVVIARDGTVSRLFVGGGPHLGDQLRDALNATLSADPKK